MTESFIGECRKLLDSEGGHASMPTVQALCAMYLTVTLQGRDRAATIFRYMAVEMLKRLKLERRYDILKKKNDPHRHALEQRVMSKTSWAVFCFETFVILQWLPIQPETDAITVVSPISTANTHYFARLKCLSISTS